MEYLPIIATVALVHLLAAMSPGPDFVMIARNSLMYSRRTGIYSAIGLGLGIPVHVTYCMVGIAFVISSSVVLFSIIKLFGAAYMIYLGYKSLVAKSHDASVHAEHKTKDISPLEAMKIGFLTNVLNPKVTLFFLGLFTLVIKPETPLGVKLFMGAEMTVVTALWFILVAYLVSLHAIKSRFHKVQHFATKFIGIVLILLGISVALSR
jgi:RhtB (resistance to homoserine/threonine) family protein